MPASNWLGQGGSAGQACSNKKTNQRFDPDNRTGYRWAIAPLGKIPIFISD
jgi:hypothetical protein